MAEQPQLSQTTATSVFVSAARIASQRSNLHKTEIAHRAGMNAKMLQRLLTGKTQPSDSQLERVFRACNVKPLTSLLLAAFDRHDLIATQSHSYLDGVLERTLDALVQIQSNTGVEIDPRWAASDAALMLERWERVISKRQGLSEEYSLFDRFK